jgi:hypothetical protein
MVLAHDDPEAAINRAYYAAFYAATAALIEVEETIKTHEGTHQRFSLHFVKSGVLPHHIGRTLKYAYNLRQRADYDALTVFDKAAVADLIADVTEFVDTVEQKILNRLI